MLRIVIGNKRYSSWSLRGWLAVKQSGLPFEETVVPMWTEEHDRVRASGLLPSGKLPTLWDGEVPVWDSLAIIEYLADRVGRDAFWPFDDAARALARSMAAEMHSGFAPLRQHCGMILGERYPGFALTPEVETDVARIEALWAEARTRFGAAGPYLFGAFGAADIMFAPVVTRFVTYDIPLSDVSRRYVDAMTSNAWMNDWAEAAAQEPWVIEKYHPKV